MWLTKTVRRKPERTKGTKHSEDDRGRSVARRTRTILRWTERETQEEVVTMDKDYQDKLERGARPGTKESVRHATKFGRIWIHCAMSSMRVVAQDNGATGAHRECRKRMSKKNVTGTEGHGEGRSSPQTNEGVHGQSSRETGEAN